MFELVRAKVALSYDFLSALEHCMMYQPAELNKFSQDWGIDVVESDVQNAISLLHIDRFKTELEKCSPAGRKMYDIVVALKAGKPVDEYPIVLVGLAESFIKREAEVRAAYVEMVKQLKEYDADANESDPKTIWAMENTEIDAVNAVDQKTIDLLRTIRTFGYVPANRPEYLCIYRALIEFNALSAYPWFYHPEAKDRLGIVTGHGIVWLNKIPIGQKSWASCVEEARRYQEEHSRPKLSVV